MRVIKASRADDLRKQRDEWDANFKKHNDIARSQEKEFRKAQADMERAIAEELKSDLDKFYLLDFDVRVSANARHIRDRKFKNVEVRIDCNQNRVKDESASLSWHYTAKPDKNGNSAKETGSWSGLSATTEQQLKSLDQSVAAIHLLSTIDWGKFLDRDVPYYDDYVTEEVPSKSDRPDFETQIAEEELADYVGKRVLVKGKAGQNDKFYLSGVSVWYHIEKVTPKFYSVEPVTDHDFDRFVYRQDNNIAPYLERIRKDDFTSLIDHPIVTKEF